MSQNAAVLGLHFMLEVAALAAMAYWGWTRQDGATRWLLATGLPILAATAWAVFRAPNDGPQALVAIPGFARLALELLVLGGAALLLWQAAQPALAAGFAALIVIDYLLQYDRVGRLLGL
ncbi:MAG TPA: YrdB family protein [Candidatus Limnocylindria bacterium]|nr:YrdB family protein [Candidatus Limnocylindria bacterium]